ncbi:MAG: cyclopropane-fatty-acyl-phospholipid synthase family protein [Pseudomonadota bacterium]|nr:cyclopropane-fatty-acyl-phospholipid synthase family protein [Pseudomonadota bacterium]
MALIDSLIGKILKQGQLTLITPDGERKTYGPGGGRALTVRVTDTKVLLDLVRSPRLGLGEAYMDGRMMIEDGNILDLMTMVVGGIRWEDKAVGRTALNKGKNKWRALFRRNPADASRRNVAHHYDVGNDLYRLFLDDDLQYSCAYFTDPANGLEQAQADKKAHIAAKLYLKPGQRVLDIGCGWGGTALYLNRVAGVEVLGVTLSEEQLKVARRRAEEAGVADKVKFELTDYRSVTGTFDRIVSIGMFEHVGAPHYDEFFAACRALLAKDGVMLLHTIGKFGKAAAAPDPFTEKYIFPGYHLPSLSQMCAASEKVRLIASDVETLRLHYAYTLRHWLERTVAARGEIEAMYDARFFRMWEFYLAGAIVGFECGTMCNYQVQYIRDRRALPITRDYMAEAEAKYRAG